MNEDELIAQLSEKHKIPEGDVREIFEEKLEECKDADLKGDQAKQRAMERTYAAFKRKDMSSSEGVEGVILGAGDRYDSVGYSRENAIESYQENPQGAIKDGEVALAVPPDETDNITGNGVAAVGEKNGWAIVARPDNENILSYDFAERDSAETDDANTQVEDGWRVYPLDTRKTFSGGDENPRYGTPTPKHQWKRRCLGLLMAEGDDEPRIGHLTLTGKKSVQNPPLFQAVQFQGRVNEGDGDELYVNSTSETEFNPNPELEENRSSIDSLIEQYFSDDYLFDLSGLYSYMAEQDGSRTVIAVGDVIDMDLEANSNDTYRMVLGQVDFSGGDMVEHEATTWVPTWHDQYIDFAIESRVYVVGRARMQDAYDPVEGERTSDEQEVVLNAQGLYADPTSKIPREDDVDDLDEDDFEAESADEESEEEIEAQFDGGEDDW